MQKEIFENASGKRHIIILNNIDVKAPRVIAYDMPAAESQQSLSLKFVSYGNVRSVCSLLHKICSEEACKIASFFLHGIRPVAFLMPIENKCCIVVLVKLALLCSKEPFLSRWLGDGVVTSRLESEMCSPLMQKYTLLHTLIPFSNSVSSLSLPTKDMKCFA